MSRRIRMTSSGDEFVVSPPERNPGPRRFPGPDEEAPLPPRASAMWRVVGWLGALMALGSVIVAAWVAL